MLIRSITKNVMDEKFSSFLVLSTHILHFHKKNLTVLDISRFTFCKVDYHGMFAPAFYQTISRPTKVTQQTATLIDNIITHMHEYPVTSGILYNDISDHFPVFNLYSMERSKREKFTTVYRRKASSENMNKLNIKIQNLNWEEV